MRWLENDWYGSFAPADRRPVIQWAAENLRFPHSARSEVCDPDTSPWINMPLDAIFDNTKKQVTNIRCTQGSGTTMFEIAACRIVAEDPGPALIVCQTDSDAQKFKQTRLDKTFAASPCVKRLMPWQKNKDRKDAILFDHMPFFVVGAGINNLQSDSYRWVFLDEGWRYKPQTLDGEAVERTTSQSFARVVRTSQGGYVNDANDQAWKLSTQHEWGFACPRCRLWQSITFGPQDHGGVRYDDKRDARGVPDLAAIRASVRYECANPACSARWEDNIQDRRALAMMGSYVQTNPDALPEYVGYHWERATVYWNAWKDLVTKWVLANESKHRGDTGPLEQFVQKVKGRAWAVEREDFKNAITLVSYVPAHPWAGEGKINGWPLRLMAVDVQRDHFWLVIRSWGDRGSSRLRFEHKPVSWEEIRTIQQQHGIYDKWVFVDSRHKPDDVFGKCALYGWTAMEGSANKTFVHHEEEGKNSLRYYSPTLPIQLGARGRCSLRRVSNLNCKDTLARLRNGDAKSEIQWEVYTGVSTDYLEQMDSESRDKTPNGPQWDNHGRPNHLWDCEKMQVGAAYMLKLIGQESVIVPGGQGDKETVDAPAEVG